MPKIIFTLLLAFSCVLSCVTCAVNTPETTQSSPYRIAPNTWKNDDTQPIKLRGTVRLPHHWFDGVNVTELSGIAWDEADKILYAINDRGSLFQLKLKFEHGKLSDAKVIKAVKLRDKNGKKLQKSNRDAEGLVLETTPTGKHLLISFERQPRIERYDLNGHYLSRQPLTKKLTQIQNYQTPNKALEALTIHPTFGIITAPEWSLKSHSNTDITLFSADGKNQWKLPRYPAKNSALVGLETLNDGSLLLMERTYNSLLSPIIISLRRVVLAPHCTNSTTTCTVNMLLEMNSHKGWFIDNYEGISLHNNHNFFIISDDNESPLQDTLLSYFQLVNEDFFQYSVLTK
jgi:hypothetical protein